MRRVNLFLKRLFDILVSAIALLVLSPLFLVVAVLIKLTMPGPVFFTQERVGKDRKVFRIIKFRTMKVDREAEKRIDTSKDKERLTETGRILRRTRIDELPQLLNVLKGDMSLVGPRPTIMRHVARYTDYEVQRLKVRPGITGLAQVNGGTSIPWKERIEFDIEYVHKLSALLDMAILFKTLAVVVLGEERFRRHPRHTREITG